MFADLVRLKRRLILAGALVLVVALLAVGLAAVWHWLQRPEATDLRDLGPGKMTG